MALTCFRLHSPHSYPPVYICLPSAPRHSRKAPVSECFWLVVSCDVCCQLALGVSLRQRLWLTCPLLPQLLYAFNFQSLASVGLYTYSLHAMSPSFPHLDHLASPMFLSLVYSCSSLLLFQWLHSWFTILGRHSALQIKATHPPTPLPLQLNIPIFA